MYIKFNILCGHYNTDVLTCYLMTLKLLKISSYRRRKYRSQL